MKNDEVEKVPHFINGVGMGEFKQFQLNLLLMYCVSELGGSVNFPPLQRLMDEFDGSLLMFTVNEDKTATATITRRKMSS